MYATEHSHGLGLRISIDTYSVWHMFRLLFYMIIIAAGFGAGFYSGIKYNEHEIVKDPNRFYELYKREFADSAQERIKQVKEALRKSLE